MGQREGLILGYNRILGEHLVYTDDFTSFSGSHNLHKMTNLMKLAICKWVWMSVARLFISIKCLIMSARRINLRYFRVFFPYTEFWEYFIHYTCITFDGFGPFQEKAITLVSSSSESPFFVTSDDFNTDWSWNWVQFLETNKIRFDARFVSPQFLDIIVHCQSAVVLPT